MARYALLLGLLLSFSAVAQQSGTGPGEGGAVSGRKVIIIDFDEDVIEDVFPKPPVRCPDAPPPSAHPGLIRIPESFREKAMGDLPDR